MSRPTKTQKIAAWLGLASLTTASGCVNLPMWKVPTPRCCQKAEDAWGCVVDHIGHQSPIDQPWCGEEYCPQGVYRVAAYGIPVESNPESEAESQGYDEPESTRDLGDLKPPSDGPTIVDPE